MKNRKVICLVLTLTIALTMMVMPASAAQTAYLRGDTDFNGKITPADYLNIQMFLLKGDNLIGNAEQATDIDGNKLVNSVDALRMLQHMIGVRDIKSTFIPKYWTAVPMTSPAQNGAGIYGGEGCQVPLFITFSETDGNIAYMGTDVGGLYKSTDGGVTWGQAAIGFGGSGATCIKTDPNNIDRVLVFGVNSAANKYNGLYLSTNGGTTYKPVLNISVKGNRDYRDSIAFDAASYSASVGGSAVAYWLFEDGTLHKSTDGGESWTSILTNADFANGHIFVHPEDSYVYIACANGFYRSTNGGTSFGKVVTENFNGMDVISEEPDNVYLSSNNGIYISTNGGAAFTKINATGLPSYPTRIEVSPANPNYMVVDNDMLANESSYSNASYYSHDGGKTWTKSSRNVTNSVTPYNERSDVHSWHPSNQNICLSLGGDMILRSTDGAKTFVWSNSGYNGAAVTDISCNVNNPALMAATNQDYNGFYSTDYGRTWKYMSKWGNNGWGGYAYGSYVVNESTVVCLKGTSWTSEREVVYTTNGGTTAVSTGLYTSTNDYTCVTGMKGDNNIVFAGDYRSTNGGKTWSAMNGCIAVFGGNESKIYGVNSDRYVVVSADKGASWSILCYYSEGVQDMVYDQQGDRLLLISDNMQKVVSINCSTGAYSTIKDFSSTRDGFGGYLTLRAIEVDPTDSNTYYVSNARQVYASDYGVLKTTNNGSSWTNITSTRDNIYYGDDGGRQVTRLCINPVTRHLFAGGGCRGIYKVALD